jgi:hypothetical protein
MCELRKSGRFAGNSRAICSRGYGIDDDAEDEDGRHDEGKKKERSWRVGLY